MELFETIVKKYDSFLQSYTPPGNATYTSKRAQNEMMESSSKLVISKLIDELTEAGMYAVMADEAKDKHTQHLNLCAICLSVYIFSCGMISVICGSPRL